MRPLGRRERQRRNLPCRASPAECCQERREFLSRPCRNFSIGRHLWSAPMRSPPRRGMVEQPIECWSDKATTFACDFPPLVFLSFNPRRGNPDAILKHDRKFEEVVENWALTLGGTRLSVGADRPRVQQVKWLSAC